MTLELNTDPKTTTNNPEEDTPQDDSLRGVLEAAIREHDEDDAADEPEAAEPTPAPAAEQEPKEAAPTEPAPAEEIIPETPTELKAPLGWDVEAKEAWKDLPDSVKKQAVAREQQVEQMLNEGAEFRKTGQNLHQIAAQYQAVLAAEGVQDPVQAMQGMLQTVSTLRMGNKVQRAQAMMQLFQNYDIDIETFDNLLVGDQEAVNQAQQQSQQVSPQDIDARVQQAIQQRDYQQSVTKANAVLNDFAAKNEFYPHVENDMRVLLSSAAQQNRPMTLKQAYDYACNMNPQIQNVLTQRASQQAGERKAAKSNAAMAIPTGNMPASDEVDYAPGKNLRNDILMAMQNNE